MKISDAVFSSIQSIISHKLRSILTLTGITIGVMAVVTMFSSIYGLKEMISQNMEKMGWNNSIIVVPKSEENNNKHRRRFMYIRRTNKPLTYKDYASLNSEIDCKNIYGMIEQWDRLQLAMEQKWVQLRATNKDYFINKTYSLKEGRFFNNFEIKRSAKVCIVGFHFAETYFPDGSPLGETITVGVNRFKIVGVLGEDEINTNGMNFNSWERRRDLRAVYIPLSTGALYIRERGRIDYIYVQAFDNDSFLHMKSGVRQHLLMRHKMTHDFEFQDIGAEMFKITEEIKGVLKTWNIALSAIASISLIVGGIGLFSTLLISINEKMMEIGVRKSIGATEKDIFSYFLIEAITLAMLGAFGGIIGSTTLMLVLSKSLKFEFPVPVEGVLLGLGFSIIIGFLSGFYPAWKASKIDPIKAIFYND